ncbi:class I SAM-dependent methyltransferase [Clostridium saccharoperbutylacetonicum]|nr:class I SAM-dependent methyltransferase [Clostridium saccharoperbutylacetonicum]AQR95634.1 hypothetical protein CLSAP_29500 [Clostridium saccharoperbutylacetonicum]NSB31495.1 2-polyprenyl-3-methyl-5-hydroxy-6-metoxy-1,4-benzoquinol methylase [Clostridium saccharoperbutylacetonicum]
MILAAEKELKVCGVDFSETSIEMAKKIATEQGIKRKL